MKRLQRGFTLLELLVVIAIIGILLALGTVSFSTAQRKSRDARRQGDIKALQDAYEQYYADNNSSYSTTGCAAMQTASYLPGGAPLDPKLGTTYTCTSDADSYCVCALLEEADAGKYSDSSCSLGVGDYACATNLQ